MDEQKLVYRVQVVSLLGEDESVKATEDFEWTTESPSKSGMYIAAEDLTDVATGEYVGSLYTAVNIDFVNGSGFGMFVDGIFYGIDSLVFIRWLGPIPIPEIDTKR
jgi:hypothetical protein